jgi:hypothetical protein
VSTDGLAVGLSNPIHVQMIGQRHFRLDQAGPREDAKGPSPRPTMPVLCPEPWRGFMRAERVGDRGPQAGLGNERYGTGR